MRLAPTIERTRRAAAAGKPVARAQAGAAIFATAALVLWATCAAAQSAAYFPPAAADDTRTTLAVDLNAGWEDNILFSDQGRSGVVTRFAMSLTHRRKARRASFAIKGSGALQYYPKNTDLTRGTYGGEASTTLTLSRRSSLSLGQSVNSSYTRENPDLLASGLLLPQTGVLRGTSRLGLTTSLSRHVSLVLGGAYTFNRFDRSKLVTDLPLVNGSQATGRAQLQFSVGPRDSLALGYGFRQSFFAGNDRRSHSLGAGWQRRLTSSLELSAGGGAVYLEASESVKGIASLDLTAHGRKVTLSAQAGRSVDQAYGLARDRVADVFSLGFSYLPRPGILISTRPAYGISNDPADPGFRYESLSVGSGLGFKLARRLAVHFHHTYQRLVSRGTQGLREANRFSASIKLPLSREWDLFE